MNAALYHPAGGYYSTPGRRVGRHGDFFTSVSVGPLFGKLLAHHVAAAFHGSHGPFRVLELGAHDGTLAKDILDTLASDHASLLDRVEYAIIEPLPSLAEQQRGTLAGLPVRIVSKAEELEPMPGILVANELVDALACHLVEATTDGWVEIGVDVDGDAFIWSTLGPAQESLVRHLPDRPAGYRTEVRTGIDDFLRPLVPLVFPGRMLFIDYGFERDDYYLPERSEGTLRTYCAHRAGDDPLDAPGTRDITAHVEFTGLREAIEAVGGRVIRFENQARFLTHTAKPWLLSLEGRTDPATLKLLRNFQTLTHPGQLGSRFHLMEAEWT